MERYPSYISGTLIQQKIIHTGFIKGHAVVNTHNARCSIYADFIKGYAGLIKGHAVFIKGHAVFIKGHAAFIKGHAVFIIGRAVFIKGHAASI